MGRALATAVVLIDDNGQPVVFNAGDTPAKKFADQITNPKAWGDDDGDVDETPADEEVEEVDDDPEDPEGGDDDGDEDKAPAKNAKLEVWQEYAESKGIELEDGATKKDYQDAVAAL